MPCVMRSTPASASPENEPIASPRRPPSPGGIYLRLQIGRGRGGSILLHRSGRNRRRGRGKWLRQNDRRPCPDPVNPSSASLSSLRSGSLAGRHRPPHLFRHGPSQSAGRQARLHLPGALHLPEPCFLHWVPDFRSPSSSPTCHLQRGCGSCPTARTGRNPRSGTALAGLPPPAFRGHATTRHDRHGLGLPTQTLSRR